jgi:hypothetical protein
MRTLIERLARVPLTAVGLLIAVCGVLAGVHVLLVQHIHETGGEEWPQWVARWTIESYWGLLPLAFLALWARRRHGQGWLGCVGAALMAFGPVAALLIAVAALVWGGILGRGDLPTSVMSLELLFYVMMLGVLVAGLLGDFVVPMFLPAGYALFGILLMIGAARSTRAAAGDFAVDPAR